MIDFNDLLRFDPLAYAETVTGKSYNDDEATSRLGLLLALQNNEQKHNELSLRDDTYYGSPFWNTLRIYTDLRFTSVHAHLFPSTAADQASDRFVVLWHENGLLATLESYGDMTNTTNLYYNWQPNEGVNRSEFTSSGQFISPEFITWSGNHDVREGLRHILSRLRDHGTLLPTWKRRPSLWLLDYSQTNVDDYDYTAINEEIIARLPETVREAITP